MMKRSRILTHAVLFLPLFLGGCRSQAESPASASQEDVVQAKFKPMAPDFKLTDIKGKKFSLSDYKGKIVFLDFWATWCPPCVASVGEVQKIEGEYKGKGVEIISLSLDESDIPVRKFVARHEMESRVALTGISDIESKYGVRGIPAFFIIDKEGRIARIYEGYSLSMPASWRKELDKLIGS